MTIKLHQKIENLIYSAKLIMFKQLNSKKRVNDVAIDVQSEIPSKVTKAA